MAQTAAWTALRAAATQDSARSIRSLFDDEPERLDRLTVEAAGLTLDLSKQPWSLGGLSAALDLARDARLDLARDRLFAGEIVNVTELRPALHIALRAPDGADCRANGEPVSAGIEAVRLAMEDFSAQVRSGQTGGVTGRPFRSIIHIGIGGSDLGPRLVWEALRPLQPEIELRFAANIDGAELAAAVTGLDPEETLVIIVSKTFRTQETLANGIAAKAWLEASLGPGKADSHLVAVTANPEEALRFGIAADRTFAFREWVGGRYSVWSAVGLSCVIGLGWPVFRDFLAGAAALDAHFCGAPLERNAPVLLALAHLYNRNGLDRPVRAVVPYARRLSLFAAYLQQLEMESNGKRVSAGGAVLERASATSVFGDAGTNGQHAFFQLLHQGTDVIPVDFVVMAQDHEGPPSHRDMLLANAIAQAEALMVGRVNLDEPHRHFPGNRPSSFILLPRLSPETLGALLALYEHKTFVEGVIWDLDSFDQWGVELGKVLAREVLAELKGADSKGHDPSTSRLIARLRDPVAGEQGATSPDRDPRL
ncbi:MAG: glucose-6-phosphate isomerase [Caulobacter sp.]|nr:glucose-6-phosphate isomerase [Caulobacter sp.]